MSFLQVTPSGPAVGPPLAGLAETAGCPLLTSCSAQNVRVFRKEIKQIALRLQEEVEGMEKGSPSLTKESFSVPGGVP